MREDKDGKNGVFEEEEEEESPNTLDKNGKNGVFEEEEEEESPNTLLTLSLSIHMYSMYSSASISSRERDLRKGS